MAGIITDTARVLTASCLLVVGITAAAFKTTPPEGISVASEEVLLNANISGAVCGIKILLNADPFCTIFSRGDQCTFLKAAECGNGLCPVDCAVNRLTFEGGIQTLEPTSPACAPATPPNTCVPGLLWGCNCNGPAGIPVNCPGTDRAYPNCFGGS